MPLLDADTHRLRRGTLHLPARRSRPDPFAPLILTDFAISFDGLVSRRFAIADRLMQKAGALLARRSYSRGEIRARLIELAPEQEVEDALDRLESAGLLNDADYAYNFALYRAREMAWGSAKIRQSLIRRHVAPHLAESAIEKVHQEISEDLILGRYLDRLLKKGGPPGDRRAVRRLISHLRSRGFDEDRIWNTLRERVPAASWQRYDMGD